MHLSHPPSIIKYDHRFILTNPTRKGSEISVIEIKNNQLKFVPIAEEVRHELFKNKCRNMGFLSFRHINGTCPKLENGQLVSEYWILCFPDVECSESPETFCFKGSLGIDFKKNIFVLKKIESPID